MSGHMKKLHTNNNFVEVTIHGKADARFVLPRKSAQDLLKTLKPFQVFKDDSGDELIPADEVFKGLYKQYGKIGSTIRGFRSRDGITQVELAKKLGIKQSHISQMEHGKRHIGKKMAHKMSKLFNTNYRLFL